MKKISFILLLVFFLCFSGCTKRKDVLNIEHIKLTNQTEAIKSYLVEGTVPVQFQNRNDELLDFFITYDVINEKVENISFSIGENFMKKAAGPIAYEDLSFICNNDTGLGDKKVSVNLKIILDDEISDLIHINFDIR